MLVSVYTLLRLYRGIFEDRQDLIVEVEVEVEVNVLETCPIVPPYTCQFLYLPLDDAIVHELLLFTHFNYCTVHHYCTFSLSTVLMGARLLQAVRTIEVDRTKVRIDTLSY
jgi:hypothetical protein